MSLLHSIFEGETEYLMERQNYMPMFQTFMNACEEIIKKFDIGENSAFSLDQEALIRSYIKDASLMFKRNDRTTWALIRSRPYVCLRIITNIERMIRNDINKDVRLEIDSMMESLQKLTNTYYAKALQSGETENTMPERWGVYKLNPGYNSKMVGFVQGATRVIDTTMEILQHYTSIDYPPIQEYKFGGKSAHTVIRDLRELESQYQEQAKREIKTVHDNVKMLIDFNDGFAWYDLRTGVSQQEASAMGHCCTDPRTSNKGGTVYSLREKTKKGIIPRVTVMILDKFTFEIKGYNNQKPNQRYHKYIVELLKSDLIEGMTGGGYKADNNFKLTDLPEAVAIPLVERKPTLVEPDAVLTYFPEGSKQLIQWFKDIKNEKAYNLVFDDLSDDYKRNILKLRPDFASVEKLIEAFGIISPEVKEWAQYEKRTSYEFRQLVRYTYDGHTGKEWGTILTWRPDFLKLHELSQVFGGKSSEFKEAVKQYDTYSHDDENRRIHIEDDINQQDLKRAVNMNPDAFSLPSHVKAFGPNDKKTMKRFIDISKAKHGETQWSTFDDLPEYSYFTPFTQNIIDMINSNTAGPAKRFVDYVSGERDIWERVYETVPDEYSMIDYFNREMDEKLYQALIENEPDREEEINELDDLELYKLALSTLPEVHNSNVIATHEGYAQGIFNAMEKELFEIVDAADVDFEVEIDPTGETDAKRVKVFLLYLDTPDGSGKPSSSYTWDSIAYVSFKTEELLALMCSNHVYSEWLVHGFDENTINLPEFFYARNMDTHMDAFDYNVARRLFKEHMGW